MVSFLKDNNLKTFKPTCRPLEELTWVLCNKSNWQFLSSPLNAWFATVQDPSHSSADSDMTQKSTPEKKFFLSSASGGNKSPRKLLKNPLKVVYCRVCIFAMIDNIFCSHMQQSPTRNVKGRHSSIISFSDKPKSIICVTCGLTTEMTIHGMCSRE